MPKKTKGKGGKGDDWDDAASAALAEKMHGLLLTDNKSEESVVTNDRAIKGDAKIKTQKKSSNSKKFAALKALVDSDDEEEEKNKKQYVNEF